MKLPASEGCILVVNPDWPGGPLLRSMLEGTGCEIMEVTDPDTAVEIAAELAPDLLLLASAEASEEQLRVCADIRNDPDTRAVPLLMMSAIPGGDRARLEALEAGAIDYVSGGVKPEELCLRVRNLIRQGRFYRDMQKALRDARAEERRREQWTACAALELEDRLHALESLAEPAGAVLEEALGLTSTLAGKGPWAQGSLARDRCDLVALAASLQGGMEGRLCWDELGGYVEGDAGLLRRMMRHLIETAANLSGEGEKRVQMRSLEEPDGTLTVEIFSKGSGIRHRSFSQLDPGRLPAQRLACRDRSELLLAFCRQAAELMGGTLGVDSFPGDGVRFWLTLPRGETCFPPNVIALSSVLAAGGGGASLNAASGSVRS